MLVRFYDGAILPRALTKIVEGGHKVLFILDNLCQDGLGAKMSFDFARRHARVCGADKDCSGRPNTQSCIREVMGNL
jgi:hypothetical protein